MGRSTINPNLIKTKLERFLPRTEEYTTYWKEEMRKIIEGIWIGNCFISGPMFAYTNYWTIEAKGVYVNPSIRDVEWEKFHLFEEARGFSGFEDDAEFHCDEAIFKLQNNTITGEFTTREETTSDQRKYLTVKDYINKLHKGNLGRPLYNNQCKNVITIEARGSGKTKLGAFLVAYTFLTDGVKDIKIWKQKKLEKELETGEPVAFPMKSNAVISSIDSKYSNKVVDDFWIGYEKIRGGQTYNGVRYPSPIVKAYTGSLKASATGLKAEFETKVNQGWDKVGSGSFIKHVTFFNKPEAANGHRSAFILIDEIGFQDNLKLTMGQVKNCTQIEGDKFGVTWLTGTSGDMGLNGASFEAKYIFENPQEYNCVYFKDEWENKDRNIGYFVPRWKVLGFKDELGNTKEDLAKKEWERLYDEARAAPDPSTLDMFLQNDPAIPSHAFLVRNGNTYPTAQLSEHLGDLETLKAYKPLLGTMGNLDPDLNDKMVFTPNNNLRPVDYPIKNNKKGGIIIYEHPSDNPPKGKYIAGCDPIGAEGKKEEIQSDSVFSLIIYKRCTDDDLDGDKVVAEYTGREDSFNETFEHARKLLLYYNAFCLYENNYSNFKTHLENKNQLYLLCKTPKVLSNIASGKEAATYGLRATANKALNEVLQGYVRDWLLSKGPNGKLNLQSLYSIGLIKELLAAGEGINTDREIAFKLVLALNKQLERVKIEETKKQSYDGFFFNKEGERRRFFT